MSAKNVFIKVGGNVVASAGFINWIQGTGTTYTVAVDYQTDYITVTDDAAGGSGDVATDTLWDAKGDLAVGSGADTADNLAVSATDGHVLTVDAASTLGVKWAAPPAGGTVTAADVTVDSTTLVGTGTDQQAVDEEFDNAIVTAQATADNHVADTSAAHAATAVSVDSTTLVGTGTDVQAVFEEVDDAIVALQAPDYLVGTATATLANEIAVGTAPGGELGGTWASPTVDATHSGSAHHSAVTIGADAEHSLAGQVISGVAASTTQIGHAKVGSAATTAIGTSAVGAGDGASNVAHVHATGAGTPSTQALGDAAATGSGPAAAMTDHKHAMPAAAVTTSGLTMATAKLLGRATAGTAAIEEITLGTNLSYTGTTLNAAGGSGAVATDAIFDAKGDLAVGTGADTAAKLTVGAAGTGVMPDAAASTGLVWVANLHPGNKGDLPTGAIAEAYARVMVNDATLALTAGTPKVALVWLPVCTVTSLSFMSGTTALVQGSTNHAWACLWDTSGNVLRQSTDDTSPVWAASTLKTFTLSSTYGITTAGLYYIGVMVNVAGGAPTQPSLGGNSIAVTAGMATVTPYITGVSSNTSQTTTAQALGTLSTLTGKALWGCVS